MRYLILSDIHANREALSAVLSFVRRKRWDVSAFPAPKISTVTAIAGTKWSFILRGTMSCRRRSKRGSKICRGRIRSRERTSLVRPWLWGIMLAVSEMPSAASRYGIFATEAAEA